MRLPADTLQHVTAAIRRASGLPFTPLQHHAAGGGCIHQSLILTGVDGRRFFLKLNTPEQAQMFAAEADGLTALRQSGAVRAPQPLAWGSDASHAWLVLEYLELSPDGNAAALGESLAALHGQTGKAFGWHRNNVIGATPQPNPCSTDWPAFLREHRLQWQLDLAQRHGADATLLESGARLLERLDAFFPGYVPVPSLLHGDLWGGNHAYVRDEPVLFDPAVYYGDREADLAMTELFGGFSSGFYAAYRAAWPLDPGYGVRRNLYNLYHVLNHFNLFAGGYAAQARRMIATLLAEIR